MTVPRINDDTQAYPSDWVRDNPITTTERMTMTERTITEQELKWVLANPDIEQWSGGIIRKYIMNAAFPPPFAPKEGEVIWVRDGEDERWVLRIFNRLFNGKYNCEADNLRKGFNWSQAKPQTPTQKGE
jgi:hypothetical protein